MFVVPVDGFLTPGRTPGATQHFDLFLLGVIDHEGDFAANREKSVVGNRKGEQRCGSCVGGGSTALEELDPGGHGLGATGGNGASLA